MQYLEISVETTSQMVEIVSDILLECGSLGVEVVDAEEIERFVRRSYNRDLYADSLFPKIERGVCVVRGFFESVDAVDVVNAALAPLKGQEAGSLTLTARRFDDSEYKDIWKQFFKPLEFSRLTVVPKWIEYTKSEPRLLIDPSNAFGTGSHETTSMCIEYICEADLAGARVADLGCGSGILAIAALMLGAREGYLTDIDPDALKNARENAALNGVTNRCAFACGSLLAGESAKFDVIIANIVADVLIELAPEIPAALNSGGRVVLSGILNTRLNEVTAAYNAVGLNVIETRVKNDWICLVLQ